MVIYYVEISIELLRVRAHSNTFLLCNELLVANSSSAFSYTSSPTSASSPLTPSTPPSRCWNPAFWNSRKPHACCRVRRVEMWYRETLAVWRAFACHISGTCSYLFHTVAFTPSDLERLVYVYFLSFVPCSRIRSARFVYLSVFCSDNDGEGNHSK